MPLKKYFSAEEKRLAKNESQKKYREANKDKCAKANATWREKNRERIKERQSLYYAENSEEILRKNRAYFKKQRLIDPVGYKLMAVRSRAKRGGLEFNLTEKDIIVPEVCPILGIKIQTTHEKFPKADSWALDRIDNNKGYVPGNVRIISHRANVYKNNMDISTVEKLLAYMKGEI